MPRLAITDGTIEALKWLALILMTVDHIDKYLFNAGMPLLFDAGRLAMPIFAVVLGYNLARQGALARGVYHRTALRLSIAGLTATPPFIALGGLAAGWWPLNIMFMLLAATAMLYLIELGGKRHLAGAAAVFLIGGSSVEFWWPALVICLAVWCYCKRPGLPALLLLIAATAALEFINGNLWALAALPVIAASSLVDLRVPRLRWVFYVFYPLHLCMLWLIRMPMRKAGYLFF
ncbi:MAG: TraX family protein [Pseudomonadota bacterium]